MRNFILLVNPFVYDVTAYDCWSKPKGLLELGAMLKRFEFEVELIDCLYKEDEDMTVFAASDPNIEKSTFKRFGTGRFFRQQVAKPDFLKGFPRRYYRFGFHPDLLRRKLSRLSEKPLAVLMTGIMTYWWRGVRDTIAIVKESLPDVSVVLGGIYPSLLPDHAKENSGADLVVARPVSKEKLLAILTSIGMKPSDGAQREKPKNEFYYPYEKATYGVVSTSEGCYRKCSYCASQTLRPKFIGYDINRVFAEIAQLSKRDIVDFAFYDDALLYQKEYRVVPLLTKIANALPELRFHTPNGMHLEMIDAHIADLMKTCGFATLRFGFETSDPDLLSRTGNKLELGRFEEKINILKKAGFSGDQIGIYVMIGLPGQSIKGVEKSLAFVRNCGASAHITEYSPIPGTPEYTKALRAGPNDFAADPELQNNSLLPLRDPVFTFDACNSLKNLCYADRKY